LSGGGTGMRGLGGRRRCGPSTATANKADYGTRKHRATPIDVRLAARSVETSQPSIGCRGCDDSVPVFQHLQDRRHHFTKRMAAASMATGHTFR